MTKSTMEGMSPTRDITKPMVAATEGLMNLRISTSRKTRNIISHNKKLKQNRTIIPKKRTVTMIWKSLKGEYPVSP